MLPVRSGKAYAMALMLVVLMVITTITVVVVSTAFRDQESSRFAAGRIEAELFAASALEDFYARVNADSQFLPDVLTNPPSSPLSGFFALNAWAQLPLPSNRLGALTQIFGVGTAACPPAPDTYRYDCFFLEVFDTIGPVNDPYAFTVAVTVRARCQGLVTRCILTRFEQRMRRTQFFDFVVSQEFTTLAPDALFPPGSFGQEDPNFDAHASYRDACGAVRSRSRQNVIFSPALTLQPGTTTHENGQFTPLGAPATLSSCVDMAYQQDANSTDSVTGPLYTADDYMTICGSPSFDDVLVAGPGTADVPHSAFRASPAPSCAGSTPSASSPHLNSPFLVQPESSTVIADAQAVPSPATVVTVQKSDPSTPVKITFTSASVLLENVVSGPITLANYGSDAGTVIVVLDVSPYVYGQGSTDVLVSGEVNGLVSVVAEGSVAIISDLYYFAAGCAPADINASCRTDLNTSDALSLTATERIDIWQSCGPSTTSDACSLVDPLSPPDLTVHGVLTSPQGYVSVPDWQSNLDTNDTRLQATLNFYGSIASRYQGVFGAYADYGLSSHVLLSGFYKNLVQDARLTQFLRDGSGLSGLPPFLVTSRTAVWTQLDVTEVGVQSLG